MHEINSLLTIEEIEKIIIELPKPEQIYQYILNLGKELNHFELEDKFLVKGCETPVWLKYDFQNNKFFFFAYCESPFISGLVFICLCIFSGKSKEEILQYNFDFFTKTKIIHFLSPRRKIGIAHLISQFKKYANEK